MPHVFHVNDTNMFHHGRTCLGVPKDDEHEVCEAVALVNLVLQSKKKRGKKKRISSCSQEQASQWPDMSANIRQHQAVQQRRRYEP